MKKVLIVLGLLIASFSFNSCEELLKDDCYERYEYSVGITGIDVDIIENGDVGTGTVQWSVVKYRCNGTTNATDGKLTLVNGYGSVRLNLSYYLHNNYDRIVVKVTYRGVYDELIEYDYNDIGAIGWISEAPSFKMVIRN